MKEETGITVVAAVGVVAAVVLAVLLLRHLASQQNHGQQPGPFRLPNTSE